MIGRGLLVLTLLSNCVLSLPVTPSQLENEDAKLLKCIVEALADVLSRPHPVPVSQECLVTLRTDDRLVTILRHHNFLMELQELAVQGGKERNQLQQDAATPDPTTQAPQATDDGADRSMLDALGGPGERSILSQKSTTENVDDDEEKDKRARDEESEEDGDSTEEMQEKRENDKSAGSHISESVDEWSEGKTGKIEEEDEDYEEKRANSEEENMSQDKKVAGADDNKDTHKNKSKEKKFHEGDEGQADKRSEVSSSKPEEEEEREVKRGSKERLKQWTIRGKSFRLKRKGGGEKLQEVPHHSKEVTKEEKRDEEELEKKRHTQRSPEEKELQMMAKETPEERRLLEEEGSASRKSEEPEIESLAAIESELENIAQKLHEMRRG